MAPELCREFVVGACGMPYLPLMFTETGMVRPLFATARCTACLIHKVAYVDKSGSRAPDQTSHS
jgi:hypothetical protein